jgi:predicted DNA-binding transcriptional regulator YafY
MFQEKMGKASSKAERYLQLEALLRLHPQGLRRTDIAKRLQVDRSTAGRYITELTNIVPIVEDDDGKLWIDSTRYLPPVRLTVNEMEAMRIAFRLFSRKIRLPFPHAAAALRKLAVATELASPGLARRLSEAANSMESHSFPAFTRRYRKTMETLIAASAEHRTVRLRHLSRRRGVTDEYIFNPYCLEPYPDGDSLHAVGFCPELNEMRTFKLERIQSVQPAEGRFEPPQDFDIESYTSSAWGIWGRKDAKPVRVLLRFSSAVADRVKETIWHESQTLEELPDGGVLFQASVAEPLEMYPWIRGWGADVEILEPKELRERFREEIRRMKETYSRE